MDNKNHGNKFISHHKEDHGSIKDEKFDFDCEINFDETDDYFTTQLENISNQSYEKGYKEGYINGYKKAKEEFLGSMKKK